MLNLNNRTTPWPLQNQSVKSFTWDNFDAFRKHYGIDVCLKPTICTFEGKTVKYYDAIIYKNNKVEIPFSNYEDYDLLKKKTLQYLNNKINGN